MSAPVTDGIAVFQNLSLSKMGSGYTFQVAMTGLASTTTSPVAVTAPKAGVGYFYPLPLDNSLGARRRRGRLQWRRQQHHHALRLQHPLRR